MDLGRFHQNREDIHVFQAEDEQQLNSRRATMMWRKGSWLFLRTAPSFHSSSHLSPLWGSNNELNMTPRRAVKCDRVEHFCIVTQQYRTKQTFVQRRKESRQSSTKSRGRQWDHTNALNAYLSLMASAPEVKCSWRRFVIKRRKKKLPTIPAISSTCPRRPRMPYLNFSGLPVIFNLSSPRAGWLVSSLVLIKFKLHFHKSVPCLI